MSQVSATRVSRVGELPQLSDTPDIIFAPFILKELVFPIPGVSGSPSPS